jgi:hypothetical protein
MVCCVSIIQRILLAVLFLSFRLSRRASPTSHGASVATRGHEKGKMSVQVAPPSVARGVGAKHTQQRYLELKRELTEFCAKGPQVRILFWNVQPRGGGRPLPPRGDVARSRARVRERAGSARAFQRRPTGFPSPRANIPV